MPRELAHQGRTGIVRWYSPLRRWTMTSLGVVVDTGRAQILKVCCNAPDVSIGMNDVPVVTQLAPIGTTRVGPEDDIEARSFGPGAAFSVNVATASAPAASDDGCAVNELMRSGFST